MGVRETTKNAKIAKVRLGDVCQVVSGATPKTSVKEYWDGEFAWVTPAELKGEVVVTTTERKLTKAGLDSCSLKLIPQGAVLLTSRAPIGKVAIAGCDMYCNQGFKNLVCSETVHNLYLYYWLKSNGEYLNSLGRGATFKEISKTIVENIKIPLPSLLEQKRIAEELDQICELKKNAEERLALMDRLVKSRFVEMFGDLQTNNKGWSIAPFEDAATIDGTLEKDFKRYADYPHIGIDSIAKGTGELVGYRTVAQDGVISGKYHFTAKHIIYSKIRPNLNKVALPDFEGLCSADAYAILPTEKADRVYLAYVLRSQFFLDYIIPLSGRTGMPKANRKQIQGFEFPLPPLALQRKFAALVAEVGKSKFVLRETVARMETLYKAKLQEYFG